MHKPLIHRGITINTHEYPGGAKTWSDEATGSGGVAQTSQGAIRQISTHLGPDPECRTCLGHGAADFAFLAYVPCPICFPEDPA